MTKNTDNGWKCKATLTDPSTSKEFLHVDKSVPTSTNQPTSLNGPGPSPEHMVGKEEEMEEITSPHEDALMALLVLDTAENVSNTNDITKAMEELQDFVSVSV